MVRLGLGGAQNLIAFTPPKFSLAAPRSYDRAWPKTPRAGWTLFSSQPNPPLPFPTRHEAMADATIKSLRESLCSEETPLAVRFRALFSLKHLATTSEDSSAIAAVEAIAAGFASPSALLKHELAYCLGQTGKDAAVKPLRDVLSDLQEDPMCRHEAAEALGALGKADNLDLLKHFRDREGEEVVVTETCEIAIDRIEWENSEERLQEKLRQR